MAKIGMVKIGNETFKTYTKPYSIAKPQRTVAFIELIDRRHTEFYDTVKYNEITTKIEEIINSLDKNTMLEIEQLVTVLECETFSAGYEAGMADIMASMTLDELGVINRKCLEDILEENDL